MRGSDILWETPESWCWTTISEIGDVVAGGTPSSKEPKYWGEDINWISPADLTGYSKKTIQKGKKSLTKEGLKNSSAKVMPAGSVHFSSRAPIGYVVISAEPLSTNQGFKSLVPAQGIFNEYVYYYLKASKQIAEKRASGTTFLELSGKAFGLLPIPLPPLNEQKRIVAKIEELFSELDNGIAALKTAREQLKVYRQAILKHAFEGKLTAKWREENADKLETPEQLLSRIQQERDTQYQQKLEEWSNLVKEWEAKGKNGKKPGKPRKQKIEIGGEIDFEGLISLPSQWEWVLLNELSEHIVDGTHHTPSYTDVGVPFISAKDIKDFKVDFSNTRYIDMNQHQELIKRCKPRPNSVLLTKSGTIGRVALVEENKEFSLFESVANIPLMGSVEGRYIAWSVYFQVDTHFGAKNQKGVAVRHLHLEDIRRLPVPLPSSEEQKLIVQQLEGFFSVINKNEQSIDNELKRAESLRQSILKKAFSGQLVPQDINDEPASKLLMKMKAEKAAQVTTKTTHKKPTKQGCKS